MKVERTVTMKYGPELHGESKSWGGFWRGWVLCAIFAMIVGGASVALGIVPFDGTIDDAYIAPGGTQSIDPECLLRVHAAHSLGGLNETGVKVSIPVVSLLDWTEKSGLRGAAAGRVFVEAHTAKSKWYIAGVSMHELDALWLRCANGAPR